MAFNKKTTPDAKELVKALVDAVVETPKKQYELSVEDVKYLGENAYSKSAWLFIAKRHGFDPDTRSELFTYEYTDEKTKLIKVSPKAFFATPKVYPLIDPDRRQGPNATQPGQHVNRLGQVDPTAPDPNFSATEDV